MNNNQKIEQLEEEIKKLHYNPEIAKHSFSSSPPKEFFPLFWDYHIKPVIEYSNKMAERYNADKESTWLGAILHDVARLTDEKPHDEVGSVKAYNLLLEKGFDNELAEKVKNIVLKHRCKKLMPETLEEKIVASADAIAHFLPPFYIWLAKYKDWTLEEILKEIRSKIDRDYNDKIFFEDEKRMVAGQYEALKIWADYK